MTTPPDPQALLRSRPYVVLLILAAVIGVPISAAAWGFLALVSKLQLLSEETAREIDHWVAKFPPGRQRSACIAALRAAQEAEAMVYSIIIVPIAASAGRDLGGEHALIQISADTGGKYYYADSMETLGKAFEHISEELRTQYLLAYYPSRRLADSDFRKIEVRVLGDNGASAGYTVRHRTGYYTSGK